MRLAVHHETRYSYSRPFSHSLQQLRLTPRTKPKQTTVEWEVLTPGRADVCDDWFFNQMHTFSLSKATAAIHVVAKGVVDVEPHDDGKVVELNGRRVSPYVFATPSQFASADGPVKAFAAAHFKPAPTVADLLDSAQAVRQAVVYQTGITEVKSTAAQALVAGRGVCQDHAHVYIACCRAIGVPCRYVSGYFYPGERTEMASHAWVDVWLENQRSQGGGDWISIDVTNAIFASDRHVRLAIGQDYETAAPVRGVRTGGGEESMRVNVTVTPL